MKNVLKAKRKLKIFALYELIISAIVILTTFAFFFNISDSISQDYWWSTIIVAFLGLIGGILLIKRNKIGLYLSMIWAFLQIFNIQVKGIVINLTQILMLNITLDMRPEADFILAFNLLGVLFLILLIIWRKELD